MTRSLLKTAPAANMLPAVLNWLAVITAATTLPAVLIKPVALTVPKLPCAAKILPGVL